MAVGLGLGLGLGLGPAPARAATPGKGASKSKSHQSGDQKAIALHLIQIDLARRLALVEIHGLARAPAPNLFTFTDERGRHFVAVAARCEEREPTVRTCALEIPPGYEKHAVAELVLHLHGLHGRTVDAPVAELERCNAAADVAAAAARTAASATVFGRALAAPSAPAPSALAPSAAPAPGADGGAR